MPGLRGAAPDPAGGATAHPRPPSLSPRAYGARYVTPSPYEFKSVSNTHIQSVSNN